MYVSKAIVSLFLITALVSCTHSSETPHTESKPNVPHTASSNLSSIVIQHDSDTELTVFDGIKVKVFSGWQSEFKDGLLKLEGPDKELSLWLLTVQSDDADAAIASAWQRVIPGIDLELRESRDPPASDGWESVTTHTYKTRAEESRYIYASAHRFNGIQYIGMLDGSIAALQRRSPQISQIFTSFKPTGLKRESFEGLEALAWDPDAQISVDTFIRKAMADYKIPGVAIAILQGGQPVFMKGYGVEEPNGNPITSTTRFMIGSNTKSFSSMMAARLIHLNKLSWDDKMTTLLPGFKLESPELLERITLADSFCACTGLPRQDYEFVFEFEDISPERRLDELATMKQTTAYKETFQYSNGLVSAGGFATARVLYPDRSYLEAYAAALQDTIIKPLGLQNTTFDLDVVKAAPHAKPHGYFIDGTYRPVPLTYEHFVNAVVPAGGLWSNLEDMARVMQVELNEGKTVSGEQYISRDILFDRREVMVKSSQTRGYGLGLSIEDTDGLQIVGHGGNTIGFTTRNDFFPQHNLGLIILANAQSVNTFTWLIRRKILETVFPSIEKKADTQLNFWVNQSEDAVKRTASKLSAPSPEYIQPLLGDYQNAALGALTLRIEKDRVLVDVGEWQSELKVYQDGETRVLMLMDPPLANVSFQITAQKTLLLDVGQQKYEFAKR